MVATQHPGRRIGVAVVGVIIMVLGVLVLVGFRVGTCVDGPVESTCTSGPAPFAVPLGIAVIAVGALVTYLGARRRR